MTNRLYYGDNLDVLRDHVATESVDLVYLDPPDQRDAIAAAVAEIEAKKASGEWDREMAESRARYEAKADRKRRFRAFLDSGAPLNDWKG